eukprot:CAMPEP_0170316502 /NCGR_PEP_ID=MMETSP0116_2-20130129/58884_1 /TAXON_ID=400756 /ORGANISM="Durinskia baltica, Strain CSIRO CS-38" /LENGTH=54 /DNA_ID=CAMNT_0010569071 /DNA_START=175 /DNA_END=339 /DNA_ORIENTATION=+
MTTRGTPQACFQSGASGGLLGNCVAAADEDWEGSLSTSASIRRLSRIMSMPTQS